MKNKNKKRIAKKAILSIGFFLVFFVLAGVVKTKAGTEHNVAGWLWSNSGDGTNITAVGYISMNSTNLGGSTNYGVSVPSNGPVSGYAWSENLGYIDFAPAAPYPGAPSNSVTRTGNSLSGWARFEEIEKAAKTGNSGGWQGWIKMSGTGQNGTPYGVTIDPTTGKLSGYAWSEELGAISFDSNGGSGGSGGLTGYGATIPMPPVLSLTAFPSARILLNPGETVATNPKSINISWDIWGQNINSCTRVCKNASGTDINCSGWTNNTSKVNGSASVTVPEQTVQFYLSCSDLNGLSKTVSLTANYGCAANICNSSTQKCEKDKGTFKPASSGDDIVCQGGCVTDGDCTEKRGINWREVSP